MNEMKHLNDATVESVLTTNHYVKYDTERFNISREILVKGLLK